MTAALIGGAWYWYNESHVVARKLEDAVASGKGPIVLSQVANFPWERVVFFGPYTDPETARRALGFDWPEYRGFGLEMADSFSLAVFVVGNRVVRTVEVSRCKPDFAAEVLAKPIAKSAATFRIDTKSGCATLVASGPA